jgi:Z1 domain
MGFGMNEAEFRAKLNYIRELVDADLNGQRVVPIGYLDQAVRQHGIIFNLSESDVERFVKHLETIYGTTQENGHILKKNFVKWYEKEKKNIDFHYWSRLKAYWIQKTILPKAVVNSVDDVSDEIMEFLGNPRDKESWNRRRGLVMGHVQMGKTTNYSALISKAADVGYRIIIVLAGQTNSLRYQTQVRLDKAFVGKSSVSDSTHTKIYEVANILKYENPDYVPRYPFCGTTQLSDFNTATAGAVGAHQGTFAEPILFVTKKNPKVLEKIADWLKGLNNGAELDGPMLLIDDEADNASVNTNANANQATEINKKIRQILKTCRQSTYVGYTATPFANIFIDPESADEMLNEDLFPADFIKSLDPPDNYVGSHRLFTEEGDLLGACVRPIPNDYQDLLHLKHKSTHEVVGLPPSLREAVMEYILFRAIRLADGNGTSHSSMLINVSRFNYVQQQVREHVDELLKLASDAVRSWALAGWEKSSLLNELHHIWEREYEDVVSPDINWDLIRTKLLDAINSIQTKLVNMKGVSIDYEKAPPEGVHLIAIGGLALARGLTLEGLAVSYALRNIGAADTLLQMGRWFGYRPGFEKLCRIHATPDLIDDFAAISESVEELRVDFQRMALLGKTPYDFGLKVRQSPTGISITAANKMRSATQISLAEDFSTRHVQAHSLSDDPAVNSRNMKLVKEFIETLSKDFPSGYENDIKNKALVWKKIPGKLVIEFIKKVNFPQTEFDVISSDGTSLLTSYIEDRLGTELSHWDIGIPYVSAEKTGAIKFPIELDKPAYCRSRSGTVRESDTVIKVNKKNAVAFGVDDFCLGEDQAQYEERVKELMKKAESGDEDEVSPSRTWAHSVARKHPLLLIHFIQLDPPEGFSMKLSKKDPVVSMGILLPGTAIKCKERKYQASKRLMAMVQALREEAVTDEVIEDE